MFADGDNIAVRLAFLRGTASNRAWAKTLGVSEAAVRNYLAGRIPPADFIQVVCERTGVSADWLVLGRQPDERTVAVLRLSDVDPQLAALETGLRRVWRHGTAAQRTALTAMVQAMDPGEKKERPAGDDADEGMAGGVA
jgi:hypothetical protein